LLNLDQIAALALGLFARLLSLFARVLALARLLALFARFLGLDHVDAHLAEHGQHILELLGINLLRGQSRVDLVMGHVAALLGGTNDLLDRGVRWIKQWAVRRGLGYVLLRRLPLLRRRLDAACHGPPAGVGPAPDRGLVA